MDDGPRTLGLDAAVIAGQKGLLRVSCRHLEGWDGPAAMTFTDGLTIGAGTGPQRARAVPLYPHPGRAIRRRDSGVSTRTKPTSSKGQAGTGPDAGHRPRAGTAHQGPAKNKNSTSAGRQPYRRCSRKNRIELRGLFSAADAAEAGSVPPGWPILSATTKRPRRSSAMLAFGQEASSAMGTAGNRRPSLAQAGFRCTTTSTSFSPR